MNPGNTNHSPESVSLEETFKRVKEIQALLQEGQLGFNESILLFEEAETLIRQSQKYLTQAEVRIQMLTGDAENGS